MYFKLIARSSLIILTVIFVYGCASEPLTQPVISPISTAGSHPALVTYPIITPNTPGIYHEVKKGETLWRICKFYNVDLEDVTKVNHITDSTSIEIGQKIFVPGNQQERNIPVKSFESEDFIWPMKGRVISSFGQVSADVVNKGINIQPGSNSDVVAVRAGKVVFYSENFGIFGKTLILEHADGISSVYARNSETFVKVGEIVPKGKLIARAGSAGSDSRKFLHFEIRKGHTPQNPLFYLP